MACPWGEQLKQRGGLGVNYVGGLSGRKTIYIDIESIMSYVQRSVGKGNSEPRGKSARNDSGVW